jgi:hypothetical protein
VELHDLLLGDLDLLEGGRDLLEAQDALLLAFGDESAELVELRDRLLVNEQCLSLCGQRHSFGNRHERQTLPRALRPFSPTM